MPQPGLSESSANLLFQTYETIEQAVKGYHAHAATVSPGQAKVLASARDRRIDQIRQQQYVVDRQTIAEALEAHRDQQSLAALELAAAATVQIVPADTLFRGAVRWSKGDGAVLSHILQDSQTPTPDEAPAPDSPKPMREGERVYITPRVYSRTEVPVQLDEEAPELPNPSLPADEYKPAIVATPVPAEDDAYFSVARSKGIRFTPQAWQFFTTDERDRNAVEFLNDIGGETGLQEHVAARRISATDAAQVLVIVQRRRRDRGLRAAQTRKSRKQVDA